MSNWVDYRTTRPVQFSRTQHRTFPANCIVNLSTAEREKLLAGALKCPEKPYNRTESEAFIENAQAVGAHTFSNKTRHAVRQILGDGFGAAWVEGLPTDPDLPPTPTTGGSLKPNYKARFVSEFVLVALGTLIDAELFNFRQEGRGSAPLIDNVVPIPGMEQQRGAGGFANNFPFHCDNAWHRMRPDYLVLVGIRGDPRARTLISSVTDVESTDLTAMMPENSYRLKPPDLYLQMQARGVPLGTRQFRIKQPLQKSEKSAINVNFNGMDCRGFEAAQWLASLEEAIESSAVGCVLKPGTAIVMDNSRTCHTRTGYRPNFGPEARWFIRGFFKCNLWKHSQTEAEEFWSEAEIETVREHGWLDTDGLLTSAFMRFIDHPMSIVDLSEALRPLMTKALHKTPVRGCRIV
jgi:L-asparagine oxygenase